MSIFIVIGMARSGTSFLTGWLNEIGIPMGKEFLPADKIMNEKGFFEDLAFSKLQHGIKDANKNLSIDNIRDTPNYKLQYTQRQFDEASNLLTLRSKQHANWGWKITAETYRILSSFWLPVLSVDAPNNQICFIVAIRHYDKTVRSLMRVKYLKRKDQNAFSAWKFKWLSVHRNQNANQYLKEWIESNKEIIQFRRNYPDANLIFTDTEFLLHKNDKIFKKINATAKCPLHYVSPKDFYEKKLMDRSIGLRYTLQPSLKKEADEIYNTLIQLMNNQKM